MKKILVMALAMAASGAGAAEYWVDKTRPDDSGDGMTKETAKRTLQAGVDLLNDGDTLYVCPGDYDEGGGPVRTVNAQTNRVNILNVNNVRIVSTHGKAVTRIVGKHSQNSSGMASDSIRCVFSDGGKGIRIEGFTLLGGASGSADVANSISCGGGFYGRNVDTSVDDPDYGIYVFADCDFIDCQALYGGAAAYATLVRCRVTRCRGERHAAAVYRGALLNCLVNQNQGGYTVLRDTVCCNVTVADNAASTGIATDSTFVNSAILHNGSGFVGSGDGTLVARYGVFSGDNGTDFASKDECICEPASSYQFVAPLYDDFRPLFSGDLPRAANAGEIASFWYVPESERYLDLERREIAKTGAIAAGCHQRVVTPEGGVMKMQDAKSYSTRGRKPFTGGLYAFAEHWPTQFLVQGTASVQSKVVYFSVGGATTYPLLDDSIWVLPPQSPEEAVTVQAKPTTKVRYVDAVNGRDDDPEYDGTSPEKAYKTIQKGVDDDPDVVVVAAGEYDEGEQWHEKGGATSNRLVIAETCGSGIRIVGAGADKTTIRGASATYDMSTENEGCGPDAVRCVLATHSCCIQGFTIADGRVVSGSVNNDTNGGGVFGQYDQTVRIHDCVITNCVAYRGDAVHGGDLRRCRIIDCGTGFGQTSRYATFRFCLFAGVNCKAGGSFGDDYEAYNCTYIARSSENGMFGSATKTRYNCIISGADAVKSALQLQGCVLYDCANVAATEGYVEADPYFIAPGRFDGRVMACTSAAGAGVFYNYASAYMIGDIDGNPMRFTDGKPMAGAYQTVTPGIRVTESAEYGKQSWSGVRELEPGETLSVSASDDEYRHCAGFRVNGEDVFSSPAQWSVTLPSPLKGDECFVVEPIWSTNWYVNAVSGDDGNDGFTPATAKRTLKAILSADYVLPGDCVHAASGVYDDGSMDQLYAARQSGEEYLTTPVRARVKAGVTLVGDGGAENTFIVGERNADAFAGVTEGMRCLNLDNGAKVIGFTLTGGSTPYVASSGEKEPWLGGGVVGPVSASSVQPVVADCIISNNWACRGGGAFGVTLVNCKVTENFATEDGTAAMATKLINCLVDRNYSETETGEAVVRYPVGIYGCTFTDRNVMRGSGVPTKWHVYDWKNMGSHPIVNSVFMGSLQGGVAHKLQNCIVNSDAAELGDKTAWEGTVEMSVAAMKLEEGTFIPALDSPALNAGSDAGLVPGLDGGRALDGVQRVYHGAVDIGCREFDYRALFAAAIGGGVKVESATRGVVLEDGAVKLVDGESVAGVWPAVGGKCRYKVCTAAEGEGVLSGILVDEESGLVLEPESSESEDTLEFRLRNAALDFAFSYAGDGAGYLAGFERYIPGTVLLVR